MVWEHVMTCEFNVEAWGRDPKGSRGFKCKQGVLRLLLFENRSSTCNPSLIGVFLRGGFELVPWLQPSSALGQPRQ